MNEHKKTKKEQIAEEVARAVGAGREVAVETVDFSDPNRPKTCLEVDFPIIPINQIAAIEGNAGKPIYQMSKWWARRRSSVFRSLLLAASMKAPDDADEAAKAVWDVYYANHQTKGALSHLKVADIFMGGGTTIVEGSRLGMQMVGVDLNPVAWFVVKNELAQVDVTEVEALLAEIEAEVKPQIMPFYACDCPRGHRGKWTKISTKTVMGKDFNPLTFTPEQRKDYRYEGPEMIYTFWAKHGPCQVTGCGHRTPILSNPVMAIKTLSVKAWNDYPCPKCNQVFDVEAGDVRMAPGVAFVIAPEEKPYAAIDEKGNVICPHCQHQHEVLTHLKEKGKNKKVNLSLLVHPQWLAGSPKMGPDGQEYGGSATDTPEATAAWNQERASQIKLIEVRGELPSEIICPETGITINTGKGTVPKKSHYECGACGTVQDVLKTVKATKKTGPVAAYAVQGYCPQCNQEKKPYGGKFFSPVTNSSAFDAATSEWNLRKNTDLSDYWPRSEVPFGFMTSLNNGGIPNHGYTHWWTMFNDRQLLILSLFLRTITEINKSKIKPYAVCAQDFVMGAFQQYLRNQNMFCIWHKNRDCFAPHLSNSNYYPKANAVENSVFSDLGYGNWNSCCQALKNSLNWIKDPWEIVPQTEVSKKNVSLGKEISGKSEKVPVKDSLPFEGNLFCKSSTNLEDLPSGSIDLVITDPPFGGLLHYSELADFFYVWMRLTLKEKYPEYFSGEYTPKALECVSNRARQPENPDGFYQRILTDCWREAHRIIKPSGILAFTFHHSLDKPWVAVLESLFEAGFYLEATYPIRSDETKGEGSKPGTFGSQQIEYDILHVCRKRTEETTRVSWGKMRREVLKAVRQVQEVLELHEKQGLPSADLQVIKRGKALEYFSRHYGKVYVDEDKEFTVRDALIGINQLLDEENSNAQSPPPVRAEPLTRQFLRLFDGHTELPRDQMQKFLRGTGISAKEFEERGWCSEQNKIYFPTSPVEIAKNWHRKQRQKMTNDYEQAMFLIGGCFEGSGINISETLKNENFRPHPALGGLLEWYSNRSPLPEVRQGAIVALNIYQNWQQQHQDQVKQLELFFGEGDD